MKVAIYELPAADGGFIYRAFAGALRSDGRTAGEALDRVAAQFSKEDGTPLVIVQHRHGDRFFSAAQVQRLEQLMSRWRTARDGGAPLTDAEGEELDRLIELETLAAGERGAAVAREAAQ
jgi:hypothetical protein